MGRGRKSSGFNCYLLASQRCIGHSYIGSSTDPHYRLRQHNGEVVGGARATSMKRPWRHHTVVRGFATHKNSLSFEWHWKHPRRSTILKSLVRGMNTVGVRGRHQLLHLMLTVNPWRDMGLQVEYSQ